MNDRWQEIERIYHEVRELDKSARVEFLAKACAGDEHLRREVELLLANAEQAGSFLESPAIEVAAESLAREVPAQWRDGTCQGLEPRFLTTEFFKHSAAEWAWCTRLKTPNWAAGWRSSSCRREF